MLPKVKAGLRFFGLSDGGYHIYDPSTARHFKLGAQEVGWLQLLDGTKSYAELAGSIPFEYFQDFFGNLNRMALLDGATAAKERFDPLKIKLGRVDPSAMLDRLQPIAVGYRIVLNVLTWPILLINFFILAAIMQGIPGFLEPAQANFAQLHFGFAAVVFYLFAVAITGAVHETSHGVVAASYGVSVPSFGFMLLLLNPAFYADVSGINNLTNRKQRIQVLAAGVKANNALILVGMVAYLATVGTALAPYFLLFVSLNIVLSLINLIPFVPYDGYYIFQELMEEGRYSARAFAATLTPGSRRSDYVIYTVIAFTLRFALLFLAINGVRVFIKSYWNSIYVDLAALAFLVIVWVFVARRTIQRPVGARG